MSKIEDIFLKYYSIPFKKPFKMINSTLNQKKGFLILIKTDEGFLFGDCSPLQGFSKESFKETQAQLLEVYEELCSLKGEDTNCLEDTILKKKDLYSSVNFALRSCINEGNISNLNLNTIKMNCLINSNLENIVDEINSKYENGYRIFKIKMGRSSFEEELTFWKNFKFDFLDSVKFIFDPNRSWTYNQLYSFEKVIIKKKLLYFEDPLQDMDELKIALKENRIPVALDESLDFMLEKGITDIKYAIVKPTIVKDYLKKIKKLLSKKTKVVLSSAFESFIGIRSICLLHSVLKLDTHIGVDTFQYYGADFSDFKKYIENDLVNLEDLSNFRINSEYICAVDLHLPQK